MRSFLKSRIQSFGHAFAGWWYVIRTQRNAWIHALASILTFIIAFWLEVQAQDWAMLLFAIALVWTAEFINTALEAAVDLHTQEIHPLAKVGKDVGAAAVLIAALTAVIIGLLILGPPLWQRLSLFISR